MFSSKISRQLGTFVGTWHEIHITHSLSHLTCLISTYYHISWPTVTSELWYSNVPVPEMEMEFRFNIVLGRVDHSPCSNCVGNREIKPSQHNVIFYCCWNFLELNHKFIISFLTKKGINRGADLCFFPIILLLYLMWYADNKRIYFEHTYV